jgi:hypothetical protein
MSDVAIRLVLVNPPAGVDFGIQRGRGSNYETVLIQQYHGRDVVFDFSIRVDGRTGNDPPNFLGPFAQGPPAARFVYVDVGTCAGQHESQWSRRMKVPLGGITWRQIEKALSAPAYRLAARIPGRGRDGTPSCGTVRLLEGWEVLESSA